MQGVKRLTRSVPASDSIGMRPWIDELFNYPFLYAVEVGHWDLSDERSRALREYLLRGGFLMVDDFHGTLEWEVFMESLRRIFPDRDSGRNPDAPRSLPRALRSGPQGPDSRAARRCGMESTYEKGRRSTPHWRGIFDDDGRLMVAINFNMDMGDAWELADEPRLSAADTALAYRFGINYIIYSMTSLGSSAQAVRIARWAIHSGRTAAGELAFARGWPLWLLGALGGSGARGHRADAAAQPAAGHGAAGACSALLQLAFLALLLVLLWRPVLQLEQIRERENVVAVLVDDSGSMNTCRCDKPRCAHEAVTALQCRTSLKDIGDAVRSCGCFRFSDRAQLGGVAGCSCTGGAAPRASATALDTVHADGGQRAAGRRSCWSATARKPAARSSEADTGASGGHRAFPCTPWVSGPSARATIWNWSSCRCRDTRRAGETLRATVSIRHQDQRSTRRAHLRRRRADRRAGCRAGRQRRAHYGRCRIPGGRGGPARPARGARRRCPTRPTSPTTHAARVVEVDDRRRSVLYIEGEPRWEYKFIRRAVEADKSLRLGQRRAGHAEPLLPAGRRRRRRSWRTGFRRTPQNCSATTPSSSAASRPRRCRRSSTSGCKRLRRPARRQPADAGGPRWTGDGGWGRVPWGPCCRQLAGRRAPSYGARAAKVRAHRLMARQSADRAARDADATRNVAQWADLPALADLQPWARCGPARSCCSKRWPADHARTRCW